MRSERHANAILAQGALAGQPLLRLQKEDERCAFFDEKVLNDRNYFVGSREVSLLRCAAEACQTHHQ
jgi:hypothetical protein